MALTAGPILNDICGALNVSIVDPIHWSQAELYRYASDAVRQLCESSTLYATTTTPETEANNALVAMPANATAVLHWDVDGNALRQTAAAEMEALEPDFASTWDYTVERYSLDTDGPAYARLFPGPAVDALAMRIIARSRPADVTTYSGTWDLPAALSECVWWRMLAECRTRQGQGSMPEVSALAKQMSEILDSALAIWR